MHDFWMEMLDNDQMMFYWPDSGFSCAIMDCSLMDN